MDSNHDTDPRTIEIVMRDAEFQKQAAWETLIAVLSNPDMEMPIVNEAMRTDAQMILAEAAQRAIDQQQELDRILSSNPELSSAMADVEAARWFVDASAQLMSQSLWTAQTILRAILNPVVPV